MVEDGWNERKKKKKKQWMEKINPFFDNYDIQKVKKISKWKLKKKKKYLERALWGMMGIIQGR